MAKEQGMIVQSQEKLCNAKYKLFKFHKISDEGLVPIY